MLLPASAPTLPGREFALSLHTPTPPSPDSIIGGGRELEARAGEVERKGRRGGHVGRRHVMGGLRAVGDGVLRGIEASAR
eukprot:2625608-Rhodomonas_salina.1